MSNQNNSTINVSDGDSSEPIELLSTTLNKPQVSREEISDCMLYASVLGQTSELSDSEKVWLKDFFTNLKDARMLEERMLDEQISYIFENLKPVQYNYKPERLIGNSDFIHPQAGQPGFATNSNQKLINEQNQHWSNTHHFQSSHHFQIPSSTPHPNFQLKFNNNPNISGLPQINNHINNPNIHHQFVPTPLQQQFVDPAFQRETFPKQTEHFPKQIHHQIPLRQHELRKQTVHYDKPTTQKS